MQKLLILSVIAGTFLSSGCGDALPFGEDARMRAENRKIEACYQNTKDPSARLLPMPKVVTHGAFGKLSNRGQFDLNTRLNGNASGFSPFLRAYERYLDTMDYSSTSKGLPGIEVDILDKTQIIPQLGVDESYTLDINKSGILIQAATVFGALHALTTLDQLTNRAGVIDALPWHIEDSPRFAHRGLLLDTSRNFFPMDVILKLLDGMAAVKLNVLHWHIVDSQSFPFKSPTLPQMARYGAYSQAEVYDEDSIKRIVSYATARGIRIIPELEMPGHTYSWGKAFPGIMTCNDAEHQLDKWNPDYKTKPGFCAEPPCGQIDPGNDETYNIVRALMGDMAALFPDNHLHVGGDEIILGCWGEDTTETNALLLKFETAVEGYIKENGKTAMCWEEVVNEFDIPMDKDNTVVSVWQKGSKKPILDKGYKIIDGNSDFLYLDCGFGNFVLDAPTWCPPYKRWQLLYGYDPTDGVDADQQDQILGAEASIWTEMVDEHNLDTRLWPRLSAFAERVWSPKMDESKKAEALGNMTKRMRCHREQLVSMGFNADPIQPEFCMTNDACDLWSERDNWGVKAED